MNYWKLLDKNSRITYLVSFGWVVIGLEDLVLRDEPISKFALGGWIFAAAIWMCSGFIMDTHIIILRKWIDELREKS